MKIIQLFTLKLLLALILIFSFSAAVTAQTVDTDESPAVVVPEQVMKQVVQRILIWYFKPRTQPKTIYLSEAGIQKEWLPTIKNVEFELLSEKAIRERDAGAYFFRKPTLSKNTYEIGFALGNPNCDYIGDPWRFRIAGAKVKLWQSHGGFGGGCSISSDYAPSSPKL